MIFGTTMQFESREPAPNGNMIVWYRERGFFDRLFNRPGKSVMFIGSGTVWRTFPGFHRCDTWTEGWLCDEMKRRDFIEATQRPGVIQIEAAGPISKGQMVGLDRQGRAVGM